MGNSTNETKPYQVAIVGDSKYGSYAFHIEGRATQKPITLRQRRGKRHTAILGSLSMTMHGASLERRKVMKTHTVTGKITCL